MKEWKMEGVKYDDGKLEWSLIPWAGLEETVKVLMFGAKKYDRNNWMKVPRKRYVDAMLRHFFAWMSGELYDKESGMSHLAHAQCCMLFLNWLYPPCVPYDKSEVYDADQEENIHEGT